MSRLITREFAGLLALGAAASLCGCGNREVKAPPENRAIAALKQKAAKTPEEPTLEAAPEVEPSKTKILRKDPKGCTWLQSEATVTVGLQDTQAQVRAAAIAEAERTAMRDFLGVDIKSRSFDFQQEGLRGQQNLIENLLQTTRLGRTLDEQVDPSSGFRDASDCRECRYYVKLKSCVMPIPADSDKDFRVELNVSQNVFMAGSEAKLTVTATRDCSIYLYDVGLDGTTSLIVPNELVTEARLKAGDTFEYPDDKQKRHGVHLVAQMPDEKSTVSAETIRVIATKTPLPSKVYQPAEGDYLAVLRRVNAKVTDWAEDVHGFTILKP